MVDVKSINLFPAMSKILKFFALSQAIGICPCIDLDSTLDKLLKRLFVPGAGINV
jgi:hypothetical protein